jgi:hypothetical protein
MDSTNCPNCHAPITPDMDYCPRCGQALPHPDRIPASETPHPDRIPASDTPRPGGEAGAAPFDGLQPRSIKKDVILSCCTCFLYCFYLIYRMTDDTHALLGRRFTAPGGRALLYTLLTCGLYGIYWSWQMGSAIGRAKQQRGLSNEHDDLIYLLLYLFGFGPIILLLLQLSLNTLIRFDQEHHV